MASGDMLTQVYKEKHRDSKRLHIISCERGTW